MNKTILYIGNDLARESRYNSAMETLSNFLLLEECTVIKSSSKKNYLLRLIAMCFSVIKNKNIVDYILIDTFSTSAFYYAFLVSQIARFFDLKYIPILHGGNLPKRVDVSKRKSKMIFNNSYKNIAPSGYLKSEFENRGFKVDIIPNSLEIEMYSFKKRETLTPKLLWVRAFKALYNPILAIEVLRELKLDFPKVKLCMVGPIKDATFYKIKKLIIVYNLEENIEFTGVLPKEKWHNKAIDFDIFINTSNVDNTPVSVIEAMALGLPVVSTKVGGLPFLVKNNIDGVLVAKNNSKEMAKAIKNLINKNDFQIAIRARKKVESFAWRVVRKKWLKLLQ